jgi:2,4'-dihydroxyacetophenone dioxygenase
MAPATNAPSSKNYKALASYINAKELPWFEWFPGHYLKLCKLNPITGQIITFIRSVTGVSLDVHFHPGTVVVYTIIEGALEFRDAKGNVTFVENWQTLLKRYHDFCTKEGIKAVDITSFESSSH